jgi:hypothetical protein
VTPISIYLLAAYGAGRLAILLLAGCHTVHSSCRHTRRRSRTQLATITTFLTPSATADDAHFANGSTFLHDLRMSILIILALVSWIYIFGTTTAAITSTFYRWCYRLHQHRCPIQQLQLRRWCGIITKFGPLHHVWHLQSTCSTRHPGPPGGVVGCLLYKTPSTRARPINRSSPKEYKHACPAYCRYSLPAAALATAQVTYMIMISSQRSGWLGMTNVSSPGSRSRPLM